MILVLIGRIHFARPQVEYILECRSEKVHPPTRYSHRPRRVCALETFESSQRSCPDRHLTCKYRYQGNPNDRDQLELD